MSKSRGTRLARSLRRGATPAEAILWAHLRNRRLAGLKFRRQAPRDGYIVDFYCAERSLVVELDGGVHAEREQREYDRFRDGVLREGELTVLRVTHRDVESGLF